MWKNNQTLADKFALSTIKHFCSYINHHIPTTFGINFGYYFRYSIFYLHNGMQNFFEMFPSQDIHIYVPIPANLRFILSRLQALYACWESYIDVPSFRQELESLALFFHEKSEDFMLHTRHTQVLQPRGAQFVSGGLQASLLTLLFQCTSGIHHICNTPAVPSPMHLPF